MENKEIDFNFRCDFTISQPPLEDLSGRENQEKCDIFVNKIPDIKNNYRVYCDNHQKIIDKINKQRALEAQKILKENINNYINQDVCDECESNYFHNPTEETGHSDCNFILNFKNKLNNGEFDD